MKADTRVPDADGFINGLEASTVEELLSDEPDASEKADELLRNAHDQADEIIKQANSQAEAITKAAEDKGYREGFQRAVTESAINRKKVEDELNSKYQNRFDQLETEYNKRFNDMEPKMVDTLTDVFGKIVRTIAEDKKDMIVDLVNSVMKNVDTGKEFLIRASEHDYAFLINNKDKICGAASNDVSIEITKDMTLERNQCIIETDAGVYDCSLDIQLENLIQDIKLISCVK